MKTLHALVQWGSLYILIGIFVAVFLWEERLPINLTDHQLLAVGLLLVFGFALIRWVNHHEANLIAFQDHPSGRQTYEK